MSAPVHFDRPGLLAIDPRAFGVVVSQVRPPERKVTRIGVAAVVSIVGPLEHHAGEGFCDSYEAILARVTEACESDAAAVVLRVDSPGGLVSGCFGTANAVRAKCDAAGKPLLAFVSGAASSAAYAIVSQADRIVLGVGSTVGSVGIIDARVDATKQASMMGLQYAIITSGERKADGNPFVALSEEELTVRQENVDALAGVFFDLVAQHRPTTAEKIKALQARSLMGQAAVENGLADEVGTFEGLLALAAGEQKTLTQASAEEPMSAARKALEEAAKGDDAEAKAAKRALAAYDKDEEEAKAEESDEKDDEEKAEGDDEKKDDKEEKKEESKASASAASASSAGNDRLSAIEATQRDMLVDARADITAEQRAFAATLPLGQVKAYLGTIPKAAKPKHAATAVVTGTRAEGQGDPVIGQLSAVTDPELMAVDQAMSGGFTSMPEKAVRRGNNLYLGPAPTAPTEKA